MLVTAMHDRSARLLAVIRTQSEIAGAGLEPDAVMALVVRRARELTDADAAVIEFVEGDETVYRAVCGTAQGHKDFRLPVACSLSGACVSQAAVLRCDDSRTDPRVNRDACARVGARALLCVPLLHDDVAVGVLKVYDRVPGRFDADAAETLELLSGLVAASLTNASALAASVRASREDALTGLGNRRGYEHHLDDEWRRAVRYGRTLTLCLFDLDGFKAVNDRLGHPAGDVVLCRAADALRVRHCDLGFRLGGDEFALVLPETALLGGRRVARRAAEALRETAGVGMSFGAAEAAHWPGPAQLHAAADAALYRSKRRGGVVRV